MSMANSNDETWPPWCHICFRSKEAGETGFLNLGDGRQLCTDCSSIAVMTQEECNFIIQNVFEFFRSFNLQVNENIPILFIDNHQMGKLCRKIYGPNGGGAEGLYFPSLAAWIPELSTYSLPVKIWFILTGWIPKKFPLCEIQTTVEYPRCEGNIEKAVKLVLGDAIVLLFGKPDVEMGGLLAHEMMHAWLYLQGGRPWKWERSVEEGICHVMYYKWLQWFSSRGFNSSHKTDEQVQHTRKLKEILSQRTEWREDEVYGQGFRTAMRAIETFGFKTTLDHAVKHGTLLVVPPVVMRNKTTATPTASMRKKTTSAPITELLWKATSSTTKSLWKATAATITNLLWKVTTTCETARFVTMEGHRHHHYHQGQSHNNLHAPMSASPTLLLVFIGILIEHK